MCECVWERKYMNRYLRDSSGGKVIGRPRRGMNEGKKEIFMGKPLKNKNFFVRPVFSRNIGRIFQKPFYHAFMTISEITTEIFANVFVALPAKCLIHVTLGFILILAY